MNLFEYELQELVNFLFKKNGKIEFTKDCNWLVTAGDITYRLSSSNTQLPAGFQIRQVFNHLNNPEEN